MAESLKCVTHKIGQHSLEAEQIYEKASKQLFEELAHVYRESGKVTDEVLSALHCLFQGTLLPALDLVDNRSVTVVSCPAGRQVYQVVGSSGTPYTCFTSNHYCTCPAYRFSVLKKEDHIMCKHLLAVKLSEAMEVTKTLEVSDQELADIITQVD